MKKLILLSIALGGVILSHAYTSVYNCTDIKDSKYTLWINIDHNSLHFSYGGNSKPILFNYRATKNKNDELIHFFRNNNYAFLIEQKPKNPINIYAYDYKGETLRYTYKCELIKVLKESYEDNNTTPITWKKSGNKMKKFMEEVAVSVEKTKIVNGNSDKQKFYEKNLDMYAFCAANYFVRTLTPKTEKALSKSIQNYGMTSQYVGSLYFSKIYKKTASKGIMSDYREKYLLLLEKDFREDRKLSKETLHKVAQCDGKIVYFNNNPSVYRDINKTFLHSKESNKLFFNKLAITIQKPAKIDEKRILESFKIWIDDYSGMTPSKMLKELENR